MLLPVVGNFATLAVTIGVFLATIHLHKKPR
jgi:hypothetical protein